MKKKQKLPDVMLVCDIPDTLRQSIVKRGLWRCCVLAPVDCGCTPYAQIFRKSVGIYSIFCLQHSIHYANKEGLRLPLPEHNLRRLETP